MLAVCNTSPETLPLAINMFCVPSFLCSLCLVMFFGQVFLLCICYYLPAFSCIPDLVKYISGVVVEAQVGVHFGTSLLMLFSFFFLLFFVCFCCGLICFCSMCYI